MELSPYVVDRQKLHRFFSIFSSCCSSCQNSTVATSHGFFPNHHTHSKHQTSRACIAYHSGTLVFTHKSLSFGWSRKHRIFATLNSLTSGLSFESCSESCRTPYTHTYTHYLPTRSNLNQLSSRGRKLASKFQRVSLPELIIGR